MSCQEFVDIVLAVAGEEERAELKGRLLGRRGAHCSWQQRRSAQTGAAVPTGTGLKCCPQEAAQGPAAGAQPGKSTDRTGNAYRYPACYCNNSLHSLLQLLLIVPIQAATTSFQHVTMVVTSAQYGKILIH